MTTQEMEKPVLLSHAPCPYPPDDPVKKTQEIYSTFKDINRGNVLTVKNWLLTF